MAPKRPKHQSRSLERHVAVDRERTWAALSAHVMSWRFTESVLADEAPWRRCTQLVDPEGLELCQFTFFIRDDITESHLSWAIVWDPEPTETGVATVEGIVAAMQAELDAIVELAESGAELASA
jgi:hypothetical protein